MSEETLVDKTLRRLKNNKIIGSIVILGIVLIALAQFKDAVIKLFPSLGENDKENNITENYMRLFGALETPIIMRIITGLQEGKSINSVNVLISENFDDDCNYCGGHIDESLIKFWNEKWEYNNVLPLRNNLWNEIVTSENFSELDLFWTSCMLSDDNPQIAFDNSLCYINSISPWNPDIYQKTEEELSHCDTNDISKNIGFLFLIIENTSNELMTNVEFNFKEKSQQKFTLFESPDSELSIPEIQQLIPAKGRNELIAEIGSAKSQLSELSESPEKALFMPKIKPNQSLIWLLGYYLKDEKDYPTTFLSDITMPISITYTLKNKLITEDIRKPKKDQAIKIELPNGWYGQ